MFNYSIELGKMNREQLLSLLISLQEELQICGNSGLRDGQCIIIGGKHAGKKPFYGEEVSEDGTKSIHDFYEGIVGQYAYLDGANPFPTEKDEEGNVIYMHSVYLERDRYKKRKMHQFIHPEDAIPLE